MLDFYAKRKILFHGHAEAQIFAAMNINDFARNYFVDTIGCLANYKFPQKNIIRFSPIVSPSVSNEKKMIRYCYFNLIRYKVWEDTTAEAIGDAESWDSPTIIREWQGFLETSFALSNVPLISRERQHLQKWLSEKVDSEEAGNLQTIAKSFPEFAVLMGPSGDFQYSEKSKILLQNYDWSKHARKYSEAQLTK